MNGYAENGCPTSNSQTVQGMYSQRTKKKHCKICGTTFRPISSLQRACSLPCAVKIAKQIEQKNRRKKTKDMREKLKTRRDYEKEAQREFNTYIRERDRDLPCISCGITRAKWDAGHYQKTSSHPELRFHEENVHKQCFQCNGPKHGNDKEYRNGLIARIGLERVEWLEGPHQPLKLSIEDLKKLRDVYRVKTKALKWAKEAA